MQKFIGVLLRTVRTFCAFVLLTAPCLVATDARADWWSVGNNLPAGCSHAVGHNFGADYMGAAQESITNVYCVAPGSLFPTMSYDTKGNPSLFSICAPNTSGGLPPFFCGSAISVCPGTQVISALNGCVSNVPYNCETCNKSNSGQKSAGNPIDISTGNKREVVSDFTTAGPDPLTLTRFYNSNTSYNGAYERSPFIGAFYGRFGYSWRSEYDSYVTSDGPPGGANWVNLIRGDGEAVHFIKSGGVWYIAYWDPVAAAWTASTAPRRDIDISIVEDVANTHWVITDASDVTETYDSIAVAGITYRTGKPLTRKFRDGYTQTLGYDTSGNNTTIDDSLGRHVSFTYGTNGFVATFTDTAGTVTHYGYVDRSCLTPPCSWSTTSSDTSLWALQTVTYPDTAAVTYLYEDTRTQNRFSLTGITDQLGHRFATWAYDGQARGTSSQHAGGAELTTIAYDDVANTRTITNGLGKQEVYGLSTFQGQLHMQNVNGLASTHTPASTVSYLFDGNGFISQMTSAEGRVTTYTHNTKGQETSRTEGFGTATARTVNTTWDTTYHIPTQIQEPGLTTNYTYTTGLLTQLTQTDTTTTSVPYSTNGQTRTWTYTYTAAGLLHTVNGPLAGTGDTTTYTYDAHGFLASVQDEVGHTTTITSVNGRGQPLSSTDPNSVVTNYTYDLLGRLKTVTVNPGAGAALTTLTYDAAGNITQIQAPDGSTLNYGYDNAHRLTQVTNGLGEAILYTLDALGGRTATNVKTAVAGTLTKTQTATFDELGRVLQQIGAASQTTAFGYDKDDNQVSLTDPRSKLYSSAFDAIDRLQQQTDPNTFHTTLAYNGKDEVTGVTDARTNATTYVRDGFGDAIQTASPDTSTTVAYFDAAGRMMKSTDARGEETDYAYDNAGRMLSKAFPDDSSENVTFTYDSTAGGNKGVGRLTGFTDQTSIASLVYDALGHTVTDTRTLTGGLPTAYTYDPAGNILTETYPSGRIVTYTRDTQGRITGITTKLNAGASAVTVVSSGTYKPFGPLRSLTFGNGIGLTLTYDLDYRLTDIDAVGGATTIQDLTYGYDLAGNITGITDHLTAGRTQTLGYDNLNRLNSASGLYGALGFTYDGVGNRLTQTAGATTGTYAYPSTSNRLTSITTGANVRSFTYAASGQLIKDVRDASNTYQFPADSSGRNFLPILNGDAVAQNLYNALGQRAFKLLGAASLQYVFDPAGHLIAEQDENGVFQREYIWLDDLPVAMVVRTGGGMVLYYIHADHLNRPQKITDASKNVVWDGVFDPFGNPVSITGALTQPLRFPGQYFDPESALAQNFFRDYDSTTGRYIQSDPVGLRGGINTYSYARSSPMGFSDPSGLWTDDDPRQEAYARWAVEWAGKPSGSVSPKTKAYICMLVQVCKGDKYCIFWTANRERKHNWSDPTMREAENWAYAAGWDNFETWTVSIYFWQYHKFIPGMKTTPFSQAALDAGLDGKRHQNDSPDDLKRWCNGCTK